MTKSIDLTGKKFGRLLVIERSGINKHNKVLWKCKCDCGNTKDIISSELKSSIIRSCGCLHKEELIKRSSKHGNAPRSGLSPEYSTWHAINQRCGNPNTIGYKNYGGRGIKIEWESFDDFLNDMGPKPSLKHSIERENVNGNYCKENCKWATPSEQARNQRNRKDNKTGIKGVRFNEKNGKYFACISIGKGKNRTLRYFNTIEEAATARKELEEKYWVKSS